MRLVELSQIVSGFLPVDLNTAANSGDWVSMKNYNHLTVVFFKNVGTPGDDPTITIEQATAVDGSDNKALTFTDIYVKQDTNLLAVGNFTLVTQVAATSYTDATSAEDAAIWIVEFDGADLDVNGGFDCVQASVGDGSAAQIGCVLYILTEPRYASATPPSAIID